MHATKSEPVYDAGLLLQEMPLFPTKLVCECEKVLNDCMHCLKCWVTAGVENPEAEDPSLVLKTYADMEDVWQPLSQTDVPLVNRAALLRALFDFLEIWRVSHRQLHTSLPAKVEV